MEEESASFLDLSLDEITFVYFDVETTISTWRPPA